MRGATLSARDVAFASGLRGYLAGDADSAVRSFRRATAIDRDFAEAWTQLGETFTHLLPSSGTSDARADSAFAEARRIDPGAAGTLLHPIEIRLRAGDAAGAAPLVAAFEGAKPDTLLRQRVNLMRECGTTPRRTDWSEPARTTPLPLLVAGLSLVASPAPPPCTAYMLSALLTLDTAKTDLADNRRYYALVGRISLAFAAGNAATVVREIDDFITRWKFGSSLFLLFAPVTPEFQPRSGELLRAEATRLNGDWRAMPFTVRLWALGGVAIHTGDRATAEAIRQELQRRADSTAALRERIMVGSLDARLALAGADTTRAVTVLTQLLRTPMTVDQLQWDEAASLAPERILLARVLLARGDWQGALSVAATVGSSWPAFMPAYRAMALDVMARAAERGSDRARAQILRAQLAALQSAARAALR